MTLWRDYWCWFTNPDAYLEPAHSVLLKAFENSPEPSVIVRKKLLPFLTFKRFFWFSVTYSLLMMSLVYGNALELIYDWSKALAHLLTALNVAPFAGWCLESPIFFILTVLLLMANAWLVLCPSTSTFIHTEEHAYFIGNGMGFSVFCYKKPDIEQGGVINIFTKKRLLLPYGKVVLRCFFPFQNNKLLQFDKRFHDYVNHTKVRNHAFFMYASLAMSLACAVIFYYDMYFHPFSGWLTAWLGLDSNTN